MSTLTYVAAGLLFIGWAILIISALSSKSEYDKLNKQFASPSTKDQIYNPSETSTPKSNPSN